METNIKHSITLLDEESLVVRRLETVEISGKTITVDDRQKQYLNTEFGKEALIKDLADSPNILVAGLVAWGELESFVSPILGSL